MQKLSITELELDGRKLLLSTEDERYGGDRKLLSAPFARRAGGEGREEFAHPEKGSIPNTRSPHPLPAGEVTWQQILPHELLVFDSRGGQP